METRVFSNQRPTHTAAVSTKVNVKSPMKWLLLLAVMLIPTLSMGQTTLSGWTLSSNSNTSRSISCGTTYTLNVASSGSGSKDAYCTITSSSNCPITVTLTANDLKPSILMTQTNYVYVYNGSGTGGTQLASWTSETSTGVSVTSTSGTVTIRFDKNTTMSTSATFSVRIYQACCGTPPSTTYSCAGDIHQIGTGTSTSYMYGPVNDYYKYSYRQILYTADEFDNRAGTIRAIAFQYAYTSAMTKKMDVKIYMANTTVDNFGTTAATSSFITTGLQQVYSGQVNYQSQGWAWIILNTPFNYTGGNLVLVIDDDSGDYDGTSYTFYYTTGTENRQLYSQVDGTTANPFSNTNLPSSPSISTYRPNTKFCVEHNCDTRPDNFAFATQSVSIVAGESYTQNVTGGSNVTYSISCNPAGIASINTSTGRVTTVTGSEGTATVTATWPGDATYCDKTATYTINIGDGCVTIAPGTSTSYLCYAAPVYSSSSGYYSYAQQLYTADEVLAAGGCQGKINNLKFHYYGTATFSISLQVFVGTTSQSSLSEAWITDANLRRVYNGTLTFAPGWVNVSFSEPIDWDGTSNIVVATKTLAAPSSTGYQFYYVSRTSPYQARYATSNSGQIALGGDNVPTVAGSTDSYRTNIKFCIDCCDDNITGDFHFEYEGINYVAGSGAPTANNLVNGTGITSGIIYSSSNTSYVTVSNAGVVTIANNVPEGDYTITATIPNNNGCDKNASYTIHVTDGCAQAGDGTNTTYTAPVYNGGTSGYYSYSQMIYGAEEILADGGCQGEIRTIKFKSSTTENFSQSVQIYMGTTLTNNLNNGWLTGNDGLQLVYSGSVTFLASAWTSITLQNSFYWNGMDNIVVAVKSTSASTSTYRYFYYTTFTTNTMRYATSSSAQIALNGSNVPSSASGTTSTARPNMKFCIDCCDDIAEGAFSYDQTEVEYAIGSGAFTPPHLTNETGMTGISYTYVSDAENGSSVGSVDANTGAVSFSGNEGYLTVTARLSVAGGCPKFARYRVFVNDGCKRIGTGTNTTNSYSLTNNYKYILSEMIYKGSEINAGGTINRISIRIAQVASSANPRTTKIYMALTDKNTFSSSTDFINPADMTEVWSGTLTNTSTGWYDFNLSRSFSVPCGKNLVIAFDMDGNTYTSDYFYYTSISGSGIRAYSDSNNPPTSGVAAWTSESSNYSELFAARPNIKLCITECNCPDLYFHVPNVTFCTNATPQHPEFTCQSSGTRNWTSSDDNVVRITNASTGAMTVVGPGNAIITLNVAATGQYCAAAASYNVRVIQNCPTLHYDLSGCTGTSTPASIPDYTGYGVTTLYDGVPTCSTPGMAFAGWCVSSDGDGAYYQPGAQFPLYRDTTLYAIFYTKCCHPDSSTVTYTHQTVTIDGSGYTVNPNQSIEVSRSDDGFFYYDLCLGEGDGKIHATVNLPDGCSYSNQSWRLEYADGTQLVTNNTGNSFEYVIDSVIGYGLTFRARAATGCWVNLNGRIRVSPGIGVTAAPIETFSVCPENYTPITIGLPEEENVQVQINRPGTNIQSTLGHADKIYLPDGIACDVNGDGESTCAYKSIVNFTDFQSGSVVRSVEDILYVSLSIEHSFIGDVYIALTCPTGQTATILKKYTNASPTACGDNIPANAWRSTGSTGVYFGVPNQSDDGSCDSTAASNAMGTPWTYAWSSNTTRGYEYAGGENGFVYESENITSSTVDSSDLNNMTQIYHPDDSFESLVGCPLNGPWYITVMDAWSSDNGWLTDWQLALSEDLAGEVWNYQVDLDTAFMSCTLNNHSKSVTIHSPEISEAGDYDCHLVLIDEYGCVRDNDLNYHFNIKDITVGVDVQGAECGVEDGYIHASVTNGGCGPTALYTYTLVSSASGATTTNNSGRFNNLGGGDYTLTVECEEGCTKNMNINIPNTGSVALTLNSAVAESCVGANDGSISVSAGSGNFTYTATDGTHNYSSTTGSFTGVAPGTYTVTVTDNGTGCQGTLENVIVAAATPLTLNITTPTTGGCPLASGQNYAITATPAGGTGTYQNYNWTTSTGTISGTGNNATIASDGACHEYVITLSLKDGNNCPVSANASFTTVDGTAPVIATTATNNYDWGCDPTIVAPTFTATDNCPTAGTALTPTVTTAGPQGTGCAKTQTWTANVSDNCGNNATEKSITYTWTESQNPTIDAIADQPAQMGTDCKYKMIDLQSVTMAAAHDGCGGTVTFVSQSVAAGTEYTQTNAVQTIPVTVTVRGTCDKPATAMVNVIIPAKDITVSIDQAGASVCAGGDTTLTATGSSSNGSLTYAWTPTTGLTPTTGASVTATVSAETTYTVTATDPAGCTATDQITVTINPEVSLSVSPTSQEKCLGVAIDPVTITVTNGTIDNEAALQAAVEALGLTYNNGAISGTPNAPGVHTFDFTAVSNQTPQCSAVDGSFTIDVTNLINPVIAGDEDICVTASEANTVLSLSETAGNNTFTYNWNAGDNGTIITGQGTNAITAQWSSAGDKTVTVTLTLDECSAQATKTIHVRPVPTATIAEVTDDVCPNAGTIDITGTNTATTADYTYTWGGTLSLNHTTATVSDPTDVVTATIPNDDCDATYNVTLNVVDNYGCKNTATPITVTVRDDEAPQVTGTMPDKDVEGCSVAQLSTLYPAATSVAELEAAATALGGSLAVSDNCTTDKSQLTLLMVGQTNTGSCPIVVTRKYVVKDQCNKVSDTISQTIHINMANDITIPVVSQSSTVDCESMAVADAITLPTVTNACGEELLPVAAPVVGNNVENCNGDKTFTYTYRDCANHERTWEYTFTVNHPDITVPSDSTSQIGCLEDTSNTFLPRQITDACGNAVTAVLVDAPDMSGYDAVSDMGNVVFHYRYTDCANQTYDWNLTYEISPSAFTPTTNGASTVSCIGQATPQAPEPRVVCSIPIDYVANPANPIDTPTDMAANGGCGTRVYEYTYTVHGNPYTWTYTYTIQPDSIVFTGDVPTRDTVECDDPSFTPTLPEVATNCGLAVDTVLATSGTYAGCEGTRVWTYTFTDCAGHSRNWAFTRVIKRTTLPYMTYRPAESERVVECLASVIAPTDLPTVVDVCGNILSDPQPSPVITDDLSSNGCSGTRTYTYTYTDCAGLDTTWTYTYTVLRTTPPAEKPNGVDGYVTAPAASTVQCLDLATTPTQLPTVLDVCGNVLEPLPGSGEYFDTIDNCEGTRTYKYNYKDCQQLTYQWIYKYTIDRTDLPEEQGTQVIASMPVACESHAIIDSIAAMPVVQDACGEILQPVNANPTADMTAFADCHGQIKYDFLYRDCAGLEFPWTFIFEVDMPASEPLTAGAATVPCEGDALEDDIQFPTHNFACGTTHTISAADRSAAPTVDITNGAGTVTFHYEYSDCEGNPYTWDFVYTVSPSPLALPADQYDTVFCVASVNMPTPTPLRECGINLFEGVVPEYESTMANGCGDTTFVFRYHANGADTAWRFHYHVASADFTLPADVEVNVECYNDETPDAAIVPVVAAGNGICEAINPSAPVRNADGTDTYDGCQGTVSWTYTYSNCSHTHIWKYTYNVQRTTVPLVSDVPTNSYVTCADLADGSFTMPTVTDACGVEITAPTPVVTPANPSNCNSTKVYTYTYVDPCNSALSSQFVYTYTVNDTVRPVIASIPTDEIPAVLPAGNCQYAIPSLETLVISYATETCSQPIWVGQTPAAGSVYELQATAYTVPVVVTVKDECNNVRTVTINVTIPANSLNLPTIAGVSICDGETATLVASPTTNAEAMPINCVWTTGSTTLSQGEAPLSIEVSPAVNTTYNVTATDQAGCTASRSVVVSVNHPTNNAFTQVVCEGYTWTNHGWSQNYTVSGDYTHDYTSVQGCPSTDTLHLTVYHNTNTEFTEQGCDSYTWTNHGWSQTYTVSGDYQHNYQTAEGCTSTDVLHLTINHNSNSTYNETACDNYTWNNHGWSQYYTVGGVYYHDYTSADGCPSTDVLNLTINYSGTGSLSVTECESFTWYGQNYNTTGDYQHHLTTVRGCDSLVTLHLTIINAYNTDLYDTVCYGAPYTWYDNTYTGTGTHTHLLVSSDGCDSVLTLHLHQLPVVRVGIDETHDCRTGQYTLLASSINSDQYEWWSEPDNGEMASQSRENEITVMPLVTTTYYAKAWPAGHEDCSVTTSRILDPVKMARAAIDAHPAYLTIDRTEWNATDRSGGSDWKAWYVDGVYYGDGHHISDKIVPPIDSLSIVLIVGNEECADTARRTIPYVNAGLWLPNAFTPSQDNNSYFGAVGTGISNYKMWVYSREGLLVFHTDAMGDKWDGTHNGEKCPQGTYTYRILYSTVAEPESENEIVGTVTLLR